MYNSSGTEINANKYLKNLNAQIAFLEKNNTYVMNENGRARFASNMISPGGASGAMSVGSTKPEMERGTYTAKGALSVLAKLVTEEDVNDEKYKKFLKIIYSLIIWEGGALNTTAKTCMFIASVITSPIQIFFRAQGVSEHIYNTLKCPKKTDILKLAYHIWLKKFKDGISTTINNNRYNNRWNEIHKLLKDATDENDFITKTQAKRQNLRKAAKNAHQNTSK